MNASKSNEEQRPLPLYVLSHLPPAGHRMTGGDGSGGRNVVLAITERKELVVLVVVVVTGDEKGYRNQ